jgi:hypothetical protein
MNNIQLHYKNESYELEFFDDFYITTKVKTQNDNIESILNALQQGGNIQQWIKETKIKFTLTIDDINVNLKEFDIELLNIDNQAAAFDEEGGGYHVNFYDEKDFITHDEYFQTWREVKQACADYIKFKRFRDCRISNLLK